ncbi:hypothetical protein Sa4125_38280 [Aureimonas sp. SA4125]|uniref:DUF29 domain-containing protein n=1 Tax=Aureimonas sp. SA4125 TaxID=2826993 RepID=UPI001CC819AA|nr:DUF29 domain-containing protein [Aureimonas sp. SA4125]BDA86286.1 hypothetical protein Sa4125_38280 [Aureimonas sp. SA4125]
MTAKPQPSLYDADFYAWTQAQAGRLRARSGEGGDIDWENVAEEIESVGRSDKREIRSRLKGTFQYLLKWQFQPEKRQEGWLSTLSEQRLRWDMIIDDSPSLRGFPAGALAGAYKLAVFEAVEATDLEKATFPSSCPYTLPQLRDSGFLPGRPQDLPR